MNIIYEDELPVETTDEEYDERYAQSKVVDGVRVGPGITMNSNAKFEHTWAIQADDPDNRFAKKEARKSLERSNRGTESEGFSGGRSSQEPHSSDSRP